MGNRLFFVGGSHFQDGEKGFLRNVHLADALHAALAFLLFFEEFALARNVAAVALGENVFADGRDGFARNDAAANRGLDRHLKHLPRNQFSQARHQVAPALGRKFAMDDQRERVDRFASDQNIQFEEVGFAVGGEVVVERSVAGRSGFKAVVKVEHDFVKRQFVGEHAARRRKILELFLNAALFLAKLQNSADGIVVGDDHRFDDGLFDFFDVAGIRKFGRAVDFDDFAGHARNAVTHARRGGDQVQAEFALQPFLYDFHVQQAEEAAAKTETERHGIFRLVKKRRVVQLQFSQRVAQGLVVVGKHRK